MDTIAFTEELNFFMENQEALVREHGGETLVLRGREILGVYPTALTAYLEAQKNYELGTFMIQPCMAGLEAYSITVTSVGVSF